MRGIMECGCGYSTDDESMFSRHMAQCSSNVGRQHDDVPAMTREHAEEIVTALEEWVDCRDDLHLARKRYDRGSPEAERAFLKCEAARERLIALMAGEETTKVQVGVPE
jgi:hypothetical protein